MRLGTARAATQYIQKAVREAKVSTSWTDPDAGYEGALRRFIARMLDLGRRSTASSTTSLAVAPRRRSGRSNALSRLVLHLTAPGVPDIYRGDELYFTLVDPDNRRPVDFEQRERALAEIASDMKHRAGARSTLLGEVVATPEDDRLKLLVTRRALPARRERLELFIGGATCPSMSSGSARARRRLPRRLGDGRRSRSCRGSPTD